MTSKATARVIHELTWDESPGIEGFKDYTRRVRIVASYFDGKFDDFTVEEQRNDALGEKSWIPLYDQPMPTVLLGHILMGAGRLSMEDFMTILQHAAGKDDTRAGKSDAVEEV